MVKLARFRFFNGLTQTLLGALPLTLIFLLVEFFDELDYGVTGAVMPALRAELGLSYAQVGLLFGLPAVTGALVEPALMLLGDTGLRKRLVIGGGLAILVALIMVAVGASFPVILLAFIIGYPASGAFVTLSQATLMDANPGREPQMMARWTVAGSLGSLLGPLFVAGVLLMGLSWRWLFVALAVLVLALVLAILPWKFPLHPANAGRAKGKAAPTAQALLQNLKEALRNPALLRWIILLELSDLLLDVFTGYVPLYFTDVVGFTTVQAGLLLSGLMLASLAADLALIPLLEKVPGRAVVRTSAAITLFAYTTWLLAPWPLVKILLLFLLRFTTMGWYQVLQGEAYAAAPGRSGTVMAVGSIVGLFGGGLAALVGFIASLAGLPAAMWFLLLGPLSLVFFVPRPQAGQAGEQG